MHDIIIIGGGISGLYLMYRLSQIAPTVDVIVLEKKNQWGGLLCTAYACPSDSHVIYERAAWRLRRSDVLMMRLLEELGLTFRHVKKTFYEEDDETHKTFNVYRSYDETINLETINPSGKWNKPMDYGIVVEGFSEVITRLVHRIRSDCLLLNNDVINVQKIRERSYLVKTKEGILYSAKKIVIACPVNFIMDWDIFTPFQSIMSGIEIMPIYRVWAKSTRKPLFDDRDDFYIMYKDNSQIISSDIPESPWFTLYYNNYDQATVINDMYASNPIEWLNIMQNRLNKVLPVSKVTDVEFSCYFDFLYLPSGTCFLQPLKDENIFMTGWDLKEKGGWTNYHIEKVNSLIPYLLCPFQISRISWSSLNHNDMQLSIWWSSAIPFIIDQNDLATCAANAIVNICYLSMKNKQRDIPAFLCSSMYLYYNTRFLMGTTHLDNGSNFDQLFEAIDRYGMIPEKMMTIEKDENITECPTKECYEYAQNHLWDIKIVNVGKERSIIKISEALIHGDLILSSIRRFKEQYVDENGYLITNCESQKYIFDHAIVITGIDFQEKRIIFLNSQGLNGGIRGHFWMSFDDFRCDHIVRHDLLYRVNASYLGNKFMDEQILETLHYMDKLPIEKKDGSALMIQWRRHRLSCRFHHVVIGNGRIVAERLSSLVHEFPKDTILWVDDQGDIPQDLFQIISFPPSSSYSWPQLARVIGWGCKILVNNEFYLYRKDTFNMQCSDAIQIDTDNLYNEIDNEL